MTAPVLAIERVSVSLPRGGDRPFAVKEVSLEVRPGEVVCIVGESGSGKSVTASAVMGLLPRGQLRVTQGSIRLGGEELTKASAARLRALRGSRMSMIFQEPMTALNPVHPVGRQIEEVLRCHAWRGDARRRVLALMDDVRLPDPNKIYHAYPHQLSGGQRQRVMIAMALILEPALLIADEPTTALDVTTQAQILALLKDLRTEHGAGVLFITHDFGVVADIAERVVVMKDGRVVETGAAEEVLRNPREDYTKMLIAAVPKLVPRPARQARGQRVLETVGVSKLFREGGMLQPQREVRAVDKVDLTLARGETLGIVGESGSGKSTVARCVARLIDPSAGAILIDNEDVAALPREKLRGVRRRVQMIFQDPYRSLNPRRTVGQSIVEGPMNYGVPRADAQKRARELVETVGIAGSALDRYPHQFSGGQRQRLCIARALAMEPEILIADEAVSALDVSVQAQVLTLLEDIRDRFNLAMLFITHDLRVAARLCDRIAVMQRGRVVETGATAQIFAEPRHDYTRELFAAIPGRHRWGAAADVRSIA
ncbi:MAG TPA: ABC transporter ATP-binding protein [Alphaproteobacteria bacterium]|jgi:peptide/nickel transport system ATP-binding protein